MDSFKEVLVAAVITIIASLALGFGNLEAGAGKFLAYFSVAVVPVFAIQNSKAQVRKASHGEFILSLVMNTMMTLLFAMIPLLLLGIL